MKRIFYSSVTVSKLVVFLLAGLLTTSITTQAQSYTIFDFITEFPTGGDVTKDNSNVALEVGVKFSVTQIGTISEIHFFKNASNTGTHVVNLWTNGGTNLATANDGGAAGTGWRTVVLPSPITVTPGNVYVASVFCPTGFYSSTINSFGGGLDRTPILVLSDFDASPPGNGVFVENPSSAFPNLAFSASNYWVDVEYTPTFPLPVLLSDLKATTTNSNVAISWKTGSETNNRGFEIQRSNNNLDWYAVSFVNGAGESTITRTYSYTDKNLAPGLYYYRLKQVDNDGKFKNSSVVTATVSGKGKILLFQNSPNPFKGSATVRFDLPAAQKVRLSILDILGREVRVLTDKVSEAGSHLITIDGTGLGRQMYYIRLQTESGTLTRNMLVE